MGELHFAGAILGGSYAWEELYLSELHLAQAAFVRSFTWDSYTWKKVYFGSFI